jgi:hypothetical protein
MSEWISVNERLPAVGQDVLILIPVCGRYNIEGGTYKGDGQFYGAWCSTRGKDCAYGVSHWMTAPGEPPK